MAVRRNDPCPCGSGKKYKQCHLRQDQVASSREHSLTAAESAAMNALFSYATRPRLSPQLVQAFQRYWGGSYRPTSASTLGMEPFRRMLEWFAYDYAVDDDGHRVIDLLLEEATSAPPAAREVIEAWSSATMSAFRVVSIEEGSVISLLDLLREQDRQVRSRFVALNAREGDLLLGRWVDLDGGATLSPMAAIYPPAVEEPLLAYVRRAYALFQEEHHAATWDAFLKTNGLIFQAFLISDKAEPFRRLIGPGTPYLDPARIRALLREHSQQEAQEQRQRARGPERRTPPGQRRASGIIVPGAPTPQSEPATKDDDQDRPHILIPGRDL